MTNQPQTQLQKRITYDADSDDDDQWGQYASSVAVPVGSSGPASSTMQQRTHDEAQHPHAVPSQLEQTTTPWTMTAGSTATSVSAQTGSAAKATEAPPNQESEEKKKPEDKKNVKVETAVRRPDTIVENDLLLSRFREGIIRFEETGLEARFLLPPADLEDPMMIFRVLLSKHYWNLEAPLLSIQSSEPFFGMTRDQQDQWFQKKQEKEKEKQQEKEKDTKMKETKAGQPLPKLGHSQVPDKVEKKEKFKKPGGNSKQYYMTHKSFEPQVMPDFLVDPSMWGSDPAAMYESKMKEIGKGLAHAAVELKGWLYSPDPCMAGGSGGRMLCQGVQELRNRPNSSFPVFLGGTIRNNDKVFVANKGALPKMCYCTECRTKVTAADDGETWSSVPIIPLEERQTTASPGGADKTVRIRQCMTCENREARKGLVPFVLDQIEDPNGGPLDLQAYAMPLDATEQELNDCKVIVYPNCSKFFQGDFREDKRWLNPGCTHYVMFNTEHKALAERFDICFKSDAIMNAVKLMVGSRNTEEWMTKYIIGEVMEGCLMVLMDNTSTVAKALADAVKYKRRQHSALDVQKIADTVLKSKVTQPMEGPQGKNKQKSEEHDMADRVVLEIEQAWKEKGSDKESADTQAITKQVGKLMKQQKGDKGSNESTLKLKQDVARQVVEAVSKKSREESANSMELAPPLKEEMTDPVGDGRGKEKLNARDRLDPNIVDRFLVFNGPKVSAEQLIGRLTLRLTRNRHADAQEFGFESAESQRIKNAWENYLTYYSNSRRHWKLAVVLHIALSALTILMITVGCYLSVQGDDSPGAEHIALFLSTLPVITAFVLSIRTLLKPNIKSGALYGAAHEVCGEIYKYRARVGEYEAHAGNTLAALSACGKTFKSEVVAEEEASLKSKQTGSDEKQAAEEAKAAQGPAVKPRTAFKANLCRIHNSILRGTLAANALEKYTMDDVRKVEEKFYRQENGTNGRGDDTDRAVGFLLAESESGIEVAETDDDGVCLFAGEDYVRFRLMPYVETFKLKARQWSLGLTLIQIFEFFAIASSGLLSLTVYRVWLPVTVAIGGVARSTQDFLTMEIQLNKTQTALEQLEEQLMWWQSLSTVQRRLWNNMQTLVCSVEQIILTEDSNFMSSGQDKSGKGGSGVKNEEDEEEGDKGGGKKGK